MFVTPIILSRHPKGNKQKYWKDIRKIISESCSHIGLPSPKSIELSHKPILNNTLHVREYPNIIQGNIKREMIHAKITFKTTIQGPVILGSGRFRGFGLMKPIIE